VALNEVALLREEYRRRAKLRIQRRIMGRVRMEDGLRRRACGRTEPTGFSDRYKLFATADPPKLVAERVGLTAMAGVSATALAPGGFTAEKPVTLRF